MIIWAKNSLIGVRNIRPKQNYLNYKICLIKFIILAHKNIHISVHKHKLAQCPLATFRKNSDLKLCAAQELNLSPLDCLAHIVCVAQRKTEMPPLYCPEQAKTALAHHDPKLGPDQKCNPLRKFIKNQKHPTAHDQLGCN
jgi:hypothetical protein